MVGFTVEIYHDALSRERQNWPYTIAPGFRLFALPPELVDGTVDVIGTAKIDGPNMRSFQGIH
jgi:hypothetical protein